MKKENQKCSKLGKNVGLFGGARSGRLLLLLEPPLGPPHFVQLVEDGVKLEGDGPNGGLHPAHPLLKPVELAGVHGVAARQGWPGVKTLDSQQALTQQVVSLIFWKTDKSSELDRLCLFYMMKSAIFCLFW